MDYKINIDTNTKHLVFGFIRMLFQDISIKNQIIPTSIILLCGQFYHSILKIICIQHNKSTSSKEYPQITIANYEHNTYDKCIIKPLISSDVTKIEHSIYDRGVCYIKEFNLPSKVIELNPNLIEKNVYDVIFGLNRQSKAYIIDNNTNDKHNYKSITAYCWKLPIIDEGRSGSATGYSHKYGLFSIGGYGNKDCFKLSFNDIYDDPKEWKWKLFTTMDDKKALSAVEMFNDDQLICCGGYYSGYLNKLEIYDFMSKEWIKLGTMNEKKCRIGLYITDDKKRMYIGGGKINSSSGTNKFEYLDIMKNKCYLLANTIGNHGANPIIWMDNTNIIHIASTWTKTFEKMDLRQKKWVQYIDGDKFQEMFGVQTGLKTYNSRLFL